MYTCKVVELREKATSADSQGGRAVLDQATVTANIPAADLARARAFYADELGLTPHQEVQGVVVI